MFFPCVLALSGYFLHLTDIHIDPHYLPGSSLDSNCHRYNGGLRAGIWGSANSDCDTPSHLVEYIFESVREMYENEENDQPDFIVITGDQARHSSTIIPRFGPEVRLLNEMVTNNLKLHIPFEVPIVPVVGNNDVHPHNEVLPNDFSLVSLAKIWKDFIPENQMTIFKELGSYYKLVSEENGSKLYVISLNTLYFFQKNTQISGCQLGSPGYNLLKWLGKTLKELVTHKVLIAGHIPPEHKSYFSDCLSDYTVLIEQHQDTIVGGIYGHVNMDNFFFLSSQNPNVTPGFFGDEKDEYFNILLDSYNEALKYGNLTHAPMVSPAIQPTAFPSYRIFKYHLDEIETTVNSFNQYELGSYSFGELLKYKQYFVNLNKVKNKGVDGIVIEKEYSTDSDLGMKDLSVYSWLDYARKIVNNKDVAEEFRKHMFVSSKR